MDVTLLQNQERALEKFMDAVIGEEPSRLDHGAAAQNRRVARASAREWLHRFAALSMRIGAERQKANTGLPYNAHALAIWKDPNTGAEYRNAPIPDGKDGVVVK